MKLYILFIGLLFPLVLFSQTITGKVTNENNEPLEGATVFWKNSTIITTTNTKGEFEISSQNRTTKLLVAKHPNYDTETIKIAAQTNVVFKLRQSQDLNEVVVKGQRQGIAISGLNPIKTEQISQVELRKSACCDLAGCFETQTTVQPQTTNVVTNAKELRLLGLSGTYNQILIDGFPMIQGLTFTYGISNVPGTLVDNIFVSKGANSVLQGFESISGQINVQTKDPDTTDKLFVNAYLNSFSEKHFNANYAFKIKNWSNLIAVHTVQPASIFDRDNDTFLDVPKLTRYLISNKLKYGSDKDWGFNTQIGMKFVKEQRIGGQVDFNENSDKGSATVYGQTVDINQPEITVKTGFRINDQHNFVLYASSFHQNQNSYFGTTKYGANQINFYANLQYEYNYSSNSLKTGFSFRHLNLSENIVFTNNDLQRTFAGNYFRQENIVGSFAENTMKLFQNQLTWIVGVRVDNHNQFGTRITPRTLLKYDLTPNAVVRANIGTGWRTVNLFSENIGLLVSSRDILVTEPLQPEKALNMGVNFTQKFSFDNITGFFSTDYYRTDFQNQIFPDYDSNATKVIIENFDGKSVSNTFQAELYLNFNKQFEFKTGYSFLDVFRVIGGQKVLLPFNPRHKVVTTFGFKTLSNKFHFDMNIHWYGQQRLPNTRNNPIAFQRPDFSETYVLFNSQLTYNFKKIELYGGCENVFDFRQERPIVGWQDPFGPFFDTSSVWGPTRGREFYIGFRFRIPND